MSYISFSAWYSYSPWGLPDLAPDPKGFALPHLPSAFT